MVVFAIKSAVVLSALYIPYVLLLRNESFVRFNRMVLLGIMLLSLVLPMLNLSFLSIGLFDQAQTVEDVAMPMLAPDGVASDNDVATSGMDAVETESVDWLGLLACAYTIGVAVTIICRIFQLAALKRRISSGTLWTNTQADGTIVHCHANQLSPFSWFRHIVISQDDMDDCGQIIISHEQAHAQLHHSADMTCAMALQAIQWFNPMVWLFTDSLQELHEYEADRCVIQGGVEMKQYQLLLIKKTVGKAWPAFTNSLKSNQLKKRFKMMLQKQSSPWRRVRALYVLPFTLITLSTFATTTQDDEAEKQEISLPTISWLDQIGHKKALLVVDGQPTDQPLASLKQSDIECLTVIESRELIAKYGDYDIVYLVTLKDERIFDICEEIPAFAGGEAECLGWINRNLKYPPQGVEYGLQGRVMVGFVVEKTGEISNVKIVSNSVGDKWLPTSYSVNGSTVTGYGQHKDGSVVTKAERDEIIASFGHEVERVVKAMPKWTPGKQRGKYVRCRFSLPISFRLN